MISLLSPGADGAGALSGEKLAAVRSFVPSDFLLTQIPEKKEGEGGKEGRGRELDIEYRRCEGYGTV